MQNFFTKSFLSFFISLRLLFSGGVAGQVSFEPVQAYTTGSNPQEVAIGDFNNDGLNDVVLGTAYYFDAVNDYSIFVYHQNSSGGLDNPVQYRYPISYPGLRAMDAGDVSDDGLSDVVIGYGDSIGIFYQLPNGTLGNYQSFYSGNTVDGVRIGDLNHDGLKDIVVSHWNDAFIRVFYQQPGGGFTSTTYPSTQAGYDAIDIGDLNNDGLNDVVLMSGQSFGGIHVYTQTNSGTLNAAVDYPLPNMNLHGVAIGDLNNDGLMDIVASAYTTNANSQYNIWFQDTTTHLLDAPVTTLSYELPEATRVASLGCDGKNQIILADAGWNEVTTYSQNSSGEYTGAYQSFGISGASHFNPEAMAVGDINNDGKKDIVVASFWSGSPQNGLLVLINNTTSGGRASVNVSTLSTSICSGIPVSFTATPTNGGTNPTYKWEINGVTQNAPDSIFIVSSLNNGDTVKCIMTSNAACVSGSPATSNAIIMTVGEGGDAGVVTSLRDTVCLGTATHLSSNGASGNDYQWQSSTTGSFSDISGATSTTYATPPLNETTSYRLIAGTGDCGDTSIAYKVHVVNAPATVYSYTASDLKLSFSAVDSNNNIASYAWNFGDSANSTEQNPTHTYAKEGTYYVCLTVYNNSNCSYTYCKDIDVGLNGVQNIAGVSAWNIFPNPFNDYVTIQSSDAEQTIQRVTVYDELGRKITERNYENAPMENVRLNLDILAEGTYFIELTANNKNYVLPLLKQR